MCSPFHTEFDILFNLDDIGIQGCNPQPFCRNRPVMTVNKDDFSGTSYDDNRFGKTFFDLVYPPFQFIFIDF